MPDESVWNEIDAEREMELKKPPKRIIRTKRDAQEVVEALPRKRKCGAYAPRGTRCKLCGQVHL